MTIRTQRDLPLKVQMRRLLWRIGYSARINVPLRAYVRPQANKMGKFEEYTDLDVLGFAVGRDVRVERVIADCKTSEKGSTERMFWLKGVSHFFRSDTAYLVRTLEPTRAARQLANRLAISIVTLADFKTLEEYHPIDSRIAWADIEEYFTEDFAIRSELLPDGLDKSLNQLIEYCRYDYWAYEEHRNLTQLGAHLRQSAKYLDASNPKHFSIFMDCLWLFTLTLCHGLEYVRRTHASDVRQALGEYVFGGQLALREKEMVAKQMEQFATSLKQAFEYKVFPPGFDLIAELISRLSRRPNSINNILRYAELLHCASVESKSLNLSGIFGPLFDELAAKLLADVAGALVSIGGLNSRFRERARDLLSASQRDTEPTEPFADATTQHADEPTPAAPANLTSALPDDLKLIP